jgi:hypothetical protein
MCIACPYQDLGLDYRYDLLRTKQEITKPLHASPPAPLAQCV